MTDAPKPSAKRRNVCAIQRVSDGRWYEESHEHGTGWTDSIRQSWTHREAQIIVRKLFERGWTGAGEARVVELHQSKEKQ